MAKVQYLTQQGFDELKKEYSELKDKKIPEIANRIDEAKQQGDLSENAEYHQAKEDMAWAQGRLVELNYILDNASILEKNTTNGTVDIGSTVKFKNAQGKEKEYTIVGAQEADPMNGLISNESPIGKAFLNAKKGDKVMADMPSGKQEFEILDIT